MKKRTIIILVILSLLVILSIPAILATLGNKTANTQPLRIYLPEGTTQEALVDTLLAHGILTDGKNTKLFNFQFSIFNSEIRPGSYVVEPHMKTLTLVRHIRNGQQTPMRLTIRKFRLPQQLNDFLNTKFMHHDFDIPLDNFHLIRPDTYEFYWTVTPQQFMQRMEKESKNFWANAKKRVKNGTTINHDTVTIFNQQLSTLDIIILASIVEEETNHDPEKPLIASVYLNRLQRGMPLQADPTVKYAVGDFTLQRILNRHLSVDSPFNTYLHTGLPPAPICLPSPASVEAVLNAPKTDYLYFCATDLMDGTHRFASTLIEHNRNAAAFHRALNARGIK